MARGLTAEFFKHNRRRLLSKLGGQDLVVLSANGLLQRSADTTYPFRQDSSFWYLTGINEPAVILVIDKSSEYLIAPTKSKTQAIFDGEVDLKKLSRTSGLQEILAEKEGWDRLKTSLKKSKTVAILPPAPGHIKGLGIYTNPARRKLLKQIKNANKNIKPIDISQKLRQLRIIKQSAELIAIEKAINITKSSLKIINKKFLERGYKNEFEVELELSGLFLTKGADGHAFEPIIASGKKACTIHPQGNKYPIDYSKPLLMDVGAELSHYAADLSETWMLNPSVRFKTVHQAVQDVSSFALGQLKSGVKLKNYEHKIERLMGEQLKGLGLIKSQDRASIRRYFPHLTSHFLGLDVHDVGDYDQPLKEGMVLTVEPGIYIPEESIGVRIEQDVLITQSGIKVL
jgi:Xaa-Pro aminopeptidase